MSRMKFFAVAGVAWIVWAGSANQTAAQGGAGQPPLARAPLGEEDDDVVAQSAAGNLSEDIEIMREILRRTFRGGPRGVAFADFDKDGVLDLMGRSSTVGHGAAVGDVDNDGWADLYVGNDELGYGTLYRNQGAGRFTAVEGPNIPVEGAYLKGYGVVFQATLPESAWPKRTSAAASDAKPPAQLWDQIRRQLKGEGTTVTERAKEPPGTDAVVLKLLAENGHNFSSLAASEKITIVLVFRKDASKKTVSAKSLGGGAASFGSSAQRMPGGAGSVAGNAGQGMPMGVGPGPVVLDSSMPPDARNLEMLGDLHLKQGHSKEAATTFTKAYEMFRSKELAAKALQAYVAAGDADSLRTAQELLGKIAKQTAEKAGKAPASGGGTASSPPDSGARSGPRKLVITVTKDAADQVAQAKMSFGDFVKKAAVERQ